MKISGEFFHFEKRRRCKMDKHLNSQAKGPGLDSALERYLYYLKRNFLIIFCWTRYILYYLYLYLFNIFGGISPQVTRQSFINYYKLCLFYSKFL